MGWSQTGWLWNCRAPAPTLILARFCDFEGIELHQPDHHATSQRPRPGFSIKGGRVIRTHAWWPILGSLSPVSEAKLKKQHYLVKEEMGFSCKLCGLEGDFDALRVMPCITREQRLATAAKEKREADYKNEVVAEELQLAEYLESLEVEEQALKDLMLLHQLTEEEDNLMKLLAEQASLEPETPEAKGPAIEEDQPVSILIDPMESNEAAHEAQPEPELVRFEAVGEVCQRDIFNLPYGVWFAFRSDDLQSIIPNRSSLSHQARPRKR